ncbi:hypothetical protein UFOVP275_42 [uncultured Caudovirales phage]|uniref:Uncharacterized protein n=1 Tax=uncultured Caudovirales phage TaxID=2100421 RepID=A0A6J5LPE3_9CAUD|nr:hypothetical protein UFOVP275_42 [uncultured Caudovirales phage]
MKKAIILMLRKAAYWVIQRYGFPPVLYPARRVVFTFTHDNLEDFRFNWLVDKAWAERMLVLAEQKKRWDECIITPTFIDTDDFTSTNGVTIKVSGYEVTDK